MRCHPAPMSAVAASARAVAILQLLLGLVRCRHCPIEELEGIRKDCFYDFEAELADTPSRSFHMMMQLKCNDSMLASYPVMADCVTTRIESHQCSNGATVMHRYRLVQTAHEHLCSARLRGRYCRELPKNLPHYVNLCIESLFDGVSQPAMCAKGYSRRTQMTVQKSQSCVKYILDLMGSPCYFLQFNFYHIRTFAENIAEDKCNAGSRAAHFGMVGGPLWPTAAAVLLAINLVR